MKQLIFILLGLISLTFQTNAAIRYVTPSGGGSFNGSSWGNAYPGTSLQTAINASGSGDEVWVAQGTYVTTSGTDRTISFSMKNGVTIYGSFTGTEITLSERNLTLGLTSVLSGEIGISGISDNSYHVFSNSGLNNTAIIDGFVVSHANDDRIPGSNVGLGGGFYNEGSGGSGTCSPIIRNCLIRDNEAGFGAGIFNNGSGGGNASPQITNCAITENHATLGGGGLDNFGISNGNASPILTNCVVYNNSAAQRAGGMYCWGGNTGNASPVLINTCFINNSAVDGGGVVADRLNTSTGSSGTSSPVLMNSIFWGNTASGIGPQFFLLGGATFNPTYSNIDLTNQTSPHILSGAGTGNIQMNPLFVNVNLGAGLDGEWMTTDDGLRLQSSSPCIDAGNNSGLPATDILSENRIKYLAADMGAYEFDSISLLSVSENDHMAIELSASPNPSNQFLKLNYRISESGQVHLSLTDLNGKQVWNFSSEQVTGNYELEIDLTSLENGVYLLELETKSWKLNKRVVKN